MLLIKLNKYFFVLFEFFAFKILYFKIKPIFPVANNKQISKGYLKNTKMLVGKNVGVN